MQKYCAAQREELIHTDVAGLVEALSTILPSVDKDALLQSTEMGEHVVESFREGLKIGADGWVDDDMAFINPWGFELSEIKVPILLYQGSVDKMVPFAHGQWLGNHLPQDILKKHLIDGQGHISIFVGQTESIIDELLAAGQVVLK